MKKEIEEQIYNLVRYSINVNDPKEQLINNIIKDLTPQDIIDLCQDEIDRKVKFCESWESTGTYWKNKLGRLEYIIKQQKIKQNENSNN